MSLPNLAPDRFFKFFFSPNEQESFEIRVFFEISRYLRKMMKFELIRKISHFNIADQKLACYIEFCIKNHLMFRESQLFKPLSFLSAYYVLLGIKSSYFEATVFLCYQKKSGLMVAIVVLSQLCRENARDTLISSLCAALANDGNLCDRDTVY